jgi:Fe-coproporphyrin III synthase
MDPGSLLQPIVQIHPTRRCNLSCLHCYSISGPGERDLLTFETLEHGLTDARAEGYKVASFSGGEPVLYRDLGRLLRHAKTLGMRTTVTSNGMLLTGARLAMLAGFTDVLAISLDGVPESHNRMRTCDHAFEGMRSNLQEIRNSGINFGFIFTLTLHNVNEIEWAAQFAAEQGAKLFQIHPLEEVGRAATTLPGSRPDEIESAYAYLEAERIRRKYGSQLFVQVDIFHRDLMIRHPGRFHAEEQESKPTLLADCVTPLVVEADGVVVPLGYGFGRQYALGSLLKDRLRDLAARWQTTGYPRFRELCRRVYGAACQPSDLPFLNWYELIGAQSVSTSPTSRA